MSSLLVRHLKSSQPLRHYDGVRVNSMLFHILVGLRLPGTDWQVEIFIAEANVVGKTKPHGYSQGITFARSNSQGFAKKLLYCFGRARFVFQTKMPMQPFANGDAGLGLPKGIVAKLPPDLVQLQHNLSEK